MEQPANQVFESLKALLPALATTFYWTNRDGVIQGMSDQFKTMVGLPVVFDPSGKTIHDIYPAAIAAKIAEHHAAVVLTGTVNTQVEEIINVSTKETKYLHSIKSPLRDATGEVIGVMDIAVDITAQKAEAKRQQKAKIFDHLKMIAESVPLNMYWLDENHAVLGVNDSTLKAIGGKSMEMFIGKTPYEFYAKDIAEGIIKNLEEVKTTGEIISKEEMILDLTTGENRYFDAFLGPLRDDDNNFIGTVGVSVETTSKKAEAERQNKAKIFAHLEKIADFMPIIMYWFDENHVVCGGNDLALKAMGGKSPKMFIGKKIHDFHAKDVADELIKNLDEVRETGKVSSKEEMIIDLTTGKERYFNAILAPLYDDNDKFIGIMGMSMEITDQKRAEKLELKAATQQIKLDEYLKFEEIVKKVAHDICSPLASLKMYVQFSQSEIAEKVRVNLIQSTDNIKDIADGILARYKRDSADNLLRKDKPQVTVLSLVLSQVVGEKRYQYLDKALEIKLQMEPENCLASALLSPLSFKRMLSNLINNAVESFAATEDKGIINVTLKVDKRHTKIIIEDNGAGIPPPILKKILKNQAVSNNKKNGHGIGMVQIQDALKKDSGKMAITSKVGRGTKITLTYPRIAPPEWLAQQIAIQKGDTVIVLDDEAPIHEAWNKRFKKYKDKIKIKHFISGEEAVEFINNSKNKDKLLLLADYQLLKQNISGLEVIQNTNIKRAILVTSYHANSKILEPAVALKVKMLPKFMAADIPIVWEALLSSDH